MRVKTSLDSLNFALAGAREGFGPFLGVYMQAKGFDPAATGLAMSLAGLSGLVATTPIGILVDRAKSKRSLLVAAVLAIAIGAIAIVSTRSIWVVGAAQVLIGIGDTSIAPLLAAITLGIVGPQIFAERVSRNEAFNHAGNAINAALSAVLGYTLGLGYVAIAIIVMAVASSAVVTRIEPGRIDHVRASGGEADEQSTASALIGTPGLLLLALTVMLFQTASGALLPFLAQARTAAGNDPSVTTGVMTVVAQTTMVGAALLAGTLGRRFGQAHVMTIGLAIAMVRGILAAHANSWAPVIIVEVLEGAAMGLSGVAIPALAASVMHGSGRSSAGLGAVLTAFGAGATLSPLVAGLVAQRLGYPAAFITLAVIAGIGLVTWTVGRRWFGDARLETSPTVAETPEISGSDEQAAAATLAAPDGR